MANVTTISSFLSKGGAQFRWFEMGRRVQELSDSQVLEFEEGRSPYPFPLLRQAWLGLLFWQPDQPEKQQVWFLKLPLDEQGLLNMVARDDFLRRIIDQFGEQVGDHQEGSNKEAHNPHSFKPSQERLAMFHALASKAMNLPVSSYYEHAQSYFSGALEWDQWRFVGFQGIAELVVRLDEDDNASTLPDVIAQLPIEPLSALCACLENRPVPVAVAKALISRFADDRHSVSPELLADLIRGVSQAVAPGLRDALLEKALNSDHATHSEVLGAIVNRAWLGLKDENLRGLFLESLADNSVGQGFFDEAMLDLVFLPEMRGPLLASLRNPNRSDELAHAMGAWFKTIGV